MSSVSHPAMPPNGCYSLIHSNLHDTSSIHSSVGPRVKRSAVEDGSPGEYSPIHIWDVAKDELLISRSGSNQVTGFNWNSEADCCLKNIAKVDAFFRDCYKMWPLKNNKHRMKIYLNEPGLPAYEAHWNSWTDSVHVASPSQNFSSISMIPDVIAHEFGHGFVHYYSPLNYERQSGALNESIADIIAIMAKHYHTNAQANDPSTNWEFAEGFLKGARGGCSLRSLKNPGRAFAFHPILQKDMQICHMNSYVELPLCEDFGGVHNYAGIPSHAFYLSAKEIGGGSWEKTGRIWLETLLNTSYTDEFSDFACRTMSTVKALNYGARIYEAVGDAWLKVGVDLRAYAHKIYDVQQSTGLKNLESSISYFRSLNYNQGLYYFDQACQSIPDMDTAVYRNAWKYRSSPLNVEPRFGEYIFRGLNGHSANAYSNVAILEKFKSTLKHYEEFNYFTPDQRGDSEKAMNKSIANACVSLRGSIDESLKSIYRTFHLDYFGTR